MAKDYSLFYYWDEHPIHGMPAYISLCIESWKRFSQADRIIRISLENVESMTGGVLTPRTLELFTPAQRSDAVMAVVLNGQRGIFMDADTILLPAFDPSVYLEKDKPTMYCTFRSGHPEPLLAFLVNPHFDQRFLNAWSASTLQQIKMERELIARRLRRLIRIILGKKVHVKWDYLGAAILNQLSCDPDMRWSANFLSATKSGFLPRADREDYGPDSVNDYWFGEGSAAAFSPADYRDGIVALQNSWIPAAFKSLPRAEVLAHPSRLGRLLSSVLS